jgi:hypothetical protein
MSPWRRLQPNAHKDCQGTCFGNATRDQCGVCFVEGDGHVANSGKDCTGLCGGKAVVDECGQCVLGTTGREFNAAKDCAGQCFGGRLPTDPYDRTIIVTYILITRTQQVIRIT